MAEKVSVRRNYSVVWLDADGEPVDEKPALVQVNVQIATTPIDTGGRLRHRSTTYAYENVTLPIPVGQVAKVIGALADDLLFLAGVLE